MVRFGSCLTVILSALLVAGAMAVVAAPPAAAQTAKKLNCTGCVKTKQIKNGQVKSKDLNSSVSKGLVKAWARVLADGTVIACWRCSKLDSGPTSTGNYKVSFKPLGTDIRGRPRLCTWDRSIARDGSNPDDNVCSLANDPTDNSAVAVRLFDMNTSNFAQQNGYFTVVIF